MPDKIQLDKDLQQKKLMRSCGFKVDHERGGYRVWARGHLRVALAIGLSPSLMRLTSHIIDQTIYRVRKHSRITMEEFATKN